MVSFLPPIGSQFPRLWLSQSEGVGQHEKVAREGGVGGQHRRAGVTGERTDHCSVLAHGSSLTSSLFSKRENESVNTSVVAPPSSS